MPDLVLENPKRRAELTGQRGPEGPPVLRRPFRDAQRSRDGRGGHPLADVRVRVAIPATDMRFIETGAGSGIREG